jgi:hypothetical protein
VQNQSMVQTYSEQPRGGTPRSSPSLEDEAVLDLRRESGLPRTRMTPEEKEERLERAFAAYATAHPDRVQKFAERLVEITEEKRVLSAERTLGLRPAARRIGIAHTTLLEDYLAGRFGAPDPDGKPRFSEVECAARKARRRTMTKPAELTQKSCPTEP